jgi:oligopeptide/dipeptide ABC transporter ATP-binding protein
MAETLKPLRGGSPAGPILEVENLSLSIQTQHGVASILDGVNFSVASGEVVGLVGESGCGKSTVVKTILGILPGAARVDTGRIVFEGRDLLALSERELTGEIRGRRIGFIPQDPALALNPNFTVGEQMLEIWRWHGPERGRSRAEGEARAIELMRRVQLPDPAQLLRRYPHQFSGGQRQRLLIAAALLCNPALIVAVEPTTALDVTTQQQILMLLADLCRGLDLSVLFVTHDFGVISQICDRVTVMYAGQTVEHGDKGPILRDPKHPYTRALINCHPDRMTDLSGIPGMVPSPLSPPRGCRFAPRCSQRQMACDDRRPRMVEVGHGRAVNCIHFDGVRGDVVREVAA